MSKIPLRASSRFYAVWLAALSVAALILVVMITSIAVKEEYLKYEYESRGIVASATIVGFELISIKGNSRQREALGLPLVANVDASFEKLVRVSRTPATPKSQQASRLGTQLQVIFLPGDPNSVISRDSVKDFGGFSRWGVHVFVSVSMLIGMMVGSVVLWRKNTPASVP